MKSLGGLLLISFLLTEFVSGAEADASAQARGFRRSAQRRRAEYFARRRPSPMSLQRCRPEERQTNGNLWLAKWDGSENRALTFGENKADASALESGWKMARFSFRARGRERQRPGLAPDAAGGEAEQLTKEKGNVEDFAWAPDSNGSRSWCMIPIRATRKKRRRRRKPFRRS